MNKHLVSPLILLVLLPCLSQGKVPFYYYNQPSSLFNHGPHHPSPAYPFPHFGNYSDLYPEPQIQTECQEGSYCTVDSFCTVNVTISPVALNLTEEEKDERGELIPCWHPESESLQVCCNIPSSEPLETEGSTEEAQQCPRIPKAFSESSCSDVASTCGNVGYPDPKCTNNELCCFDGCANRCISDLSPEPEESSSASETISNFLSSSSHGSGGYSYLPYRQYPVDYNNYYYPYYNQQYHNPYQAYQPTTPQPHTERPFKAIFSQSPSYSLITSSARQEEAPARTSEPVRTTSPSPSFPAPETARHTFSYSNQQTFGYVQRPAPSPPKTHEALTQSRPAIPSQRYSPYYSHQPVVPAPVEPPKPRPNYYEYEQPQTPYRPVEAVQYSGYEVTPSPSGSHESCPSAMKCIPKKNCDFNGVIVSHVVSTSPEFDVVRVPLLTCGNNYSGEDAYVCCRDPTHVDRYPYY